MGDELEGNFWVEGLPSCIQSKLECLHRSSGHNFLWKFVPVRDYSNAKRMLAATGLTPLLVNLESMTATPNVGGGSKDCVTCEVEETVHYFVHASHHGFFYGLGKITAAAEGLSHMGRGAAP